MSRILVISPHPDDEALGCGGTIREHAVNGDEVRVVFLTSGELGGHGRSIEETRALREGEAQVAAGVLGIADLEFWREPDGSLTAHATLRQRLRSLMDTWAPSMVYVPHEQEAHPDHRAAARLVSRTCSMSQRTDTECVVRMFEVWTPLRVFDDIVDITPFIDVKIDAVRAYKTQCAVMGFEAAFRGLNRYRGEMHSWPGGAYAEVFKNLRAVRT